MKVLQINIFGNLSTGRIAVDLYRTLSSKGFEGKVAFARNSIADDVESIKIGNKFGVYCDGVLTRLTDKAGFFSRSATKKLIKQIDKYDPDIIHLHNLHGYYINIEILFDYLKKRNKPVVWTLHDCWAYTGHCCYYSIANCNRWINGCYNCPQKKSYPKSLFNDNSKWNYERKKELFTSVPNMHLVTVSEWLSNEISKSFLKDIPRSTIYNGIDTNIFKPTESTFRKEYNIENKFIVLGVASTWDARKRLEDFVELSHLLDERFQIVVIGVDSKQKKKLPNNIIALSRTDSTQQLAAIYSCADVFFNASVEETFGLPTIEAIACHTPVIVYDSTALPEVVSEKNGVVVPKCDILSVKNTILKIYDKNIDFNFDEFNYDKNIYYRNYISLYEKVLKEK